MLTKLSSLPPWPAYRVQHAATVSRDAAESGLERQTNVIRTMTRGSKVGCVEKKISLWPGGDLTKLELKKGAIVNASNTFLRRGGGVCGAIFAAAGTGNLEKACRPLAPCPTGGSRITPGFALPAKSIIHTVGPTDGCIASLRSAYKSALDLALKNDLDIAFPCVSTGIYGFDNAEAAQIAITEVRRWLLDHPEVFDRVVFSTFLPVDTKIYHALLDTAFPVNDDALHMSESL